MVELKEYNGMYVEHWEVARFVVVTGRKLFGLLPRVEKWCAHFPEDFQLPHAGSEIRAAPRFYRMRVIGSLGPKGHYGHRGICDHELFISKVLAVEETNRPGPIW